MSVVIKAEGLSKIYESAMGGQDVHALTELNLEVQSGEILAYLGPNGSGKTTTIKMLLGLIFPTSGSIEILGSKNPTSPAIKKEIGYLPEGAYYPDFLKGEEILKYYGQLYGLSGKDLSTRIDKVIEQVGMQHARKRLLRGYSKGMRQRIGLAQALISDPKILILDEPTTGLDPIARKEIRDIILNLREEGKTLMISSHELLEVELISDRISILFEGVQQTMGTITELLNERELSIEIEAVSADVLKALDEKGLKAEDQVGERINLRANPSLTTYDAMEICKASNVTIIGVAPRRETLEELFVRVVGGALEAKRS